MVKVCVVVATQAKLLLVKVGVTVISVLIADEPEF